MQRYNSIKRQHNANAACSWAEHATVYMDTYTAHITNILYTHDTTNAHIVKPQHIVCVRGAKHSQLGNPDNRKLYFSA